MSDTTTVTITATVVIDRPGSYEQRRSIADMRSAVLRRLADFRPISVKVEASTDE